MASFDRPILRRTLQVLCLGIACCITLPAAADSLPEIQRLMKQHQYPQALEKVDIYLSSRPKDAQGRFLKGLILTEMDRPTQAIEVFTKLTEDYPELPEPYNNLAVLYAQQKQYDRARHALEMAIRTHPSYAIAYENLGDVYAKLASQAYDKALQLDSANAAAQNKLALIRDLVSTPVKPGQSRPAVASTTVAAAPVAPPAPMPAPAAVTTPPVKVVTTTPAASASSTPQLLPPPPPSRGLPSSATPSSSGTTSLAAAPQEPLFPTKADGASSSSSSAASSPSTAAPPSPAAQDVAKALASWADAWSKKDTKAYLSHYSPNFTPPKGMSRKTWESEREERISRPSWIKVSYDEPRISVDGNQATVKIRQHYKASNLKSSSNKTLVFKKSGNNWLIVSEASR